MDDTEVISFLLQTEIIPLCLRIMDNGSELSKTVATFIIQKILLDDMGLNYICATYERFSTVSSVLRYFYLALSSAACCFFCFPLLRSLLPFFSLLFFVLFFTAWISHASLVVCPIHLPCSRTQLLRGNYAAKSWRVWWSDHPFVSSNTLFAVISVYRIIVALGTPCGVVCHHS